MYRPPLHVHVLTLDADDEANAFADDLTGWLSGHPDDPTRSHADVPAFRWSGSERGAPDVPLGEAQCSVLVLVTAPKSLATTPWWKHANAVARRYADARRAIVHVALTPGFENMGAPLILVPAVRGMNASQEEIRLQVLHAIACNLREVRQTRRPRLFLSHAKRDGLQAAEGVRRYLDATPTAGPLFDAVHLAPSGHLLEEPTANLKDSAVIVFLTDEYANRPWCRREVLIAKQNHLPLLVVDLLQQEERSSALYFGDCPRMRLSDGPNLRRLDDIESEDARLRAEGARLDPAARAEAQARRGEIAVERQHLREAFERPAVRVLAAAMLTVLRTEHATARTESVRDATPEWSSAQVLGRSPELFALLPPRAAGEGPLRLLHPEPPLPSYEIKLIAEHRRDVVIGSVIDALAGRSDNEHLLHDRMIALSISDGPDRGAFGMTKRLQEQTRTLLTHHLLKDGARLGFGGDLRTGGCTEQLFDLICAARDHRDPSPDAAVRSWLAWPLSLTLDDVGMAALPHMIDVERMPMPTGFGLDPRKFIDPNTMDPKERFGWSVSTRRVREDMALHCNARVMLGGQFRDVGPMPGLVDELTTFLDARKPLYLMGGFGGMTRVLIRALKGETGLKQLTPEFQDEGGRGPLRAYYDAQAAEGALPGMLPTDYASVVARLNNVGVGGLDNGLSDAENERLFFTRDPIEMVALVLQGLRKRLTAQ